ncbi:GAF domain-containing protein [Streptomyces sp. SolWspMP-sol7th]|uniref:ATP-binding SpoIIE family protein phosphatase n=1 Tax=Streptomyces sp. SolWspMP-sol7th TaxID=1839776 RepID=UPI00081E1376|nr:ATP-binding SpoIIE family protein phosphatase [Streptomyces sp. SolWspMP-sol7th]SCE27578.1 GAF domain-containing protein [Streptomyces sp. SolWspMP-sol7th]
MTGSGGGATPPGGQEAPGGHDPDGGQDPEEGRGADGAQDGDESRGADGAHDEGQSRGADGAQVPDEGHSAAERAQIDHLNALEAPHRTPAGKEKGEPDPTWAKNDSTRVQDPERPLEEPLPQPPPPPHPIPSRAAALLATGHELAETVTMDEALRVTARLRDEQGFDLNGQVVFGVGENFLHAEGQSGYRAPGQTDTGELRMPLSTRHPATEVAHTGRAVWLESPEAYARGYPAMWRLTSRRGREAWAYLPLVTGGKVQGVWLAAFGAPRVFSAADRALLRTAAALLTSALERSRTGAAELALSRGLRSSMGAAAGGVRKGLTVANRYVPTGGGLMVGGDWYDVIQLPGGKIACVVGDVQGHDVHAAGLMSQLRTAVHAYAAEGHGPDAILARTSRFLAALDEDRFATCLYVEADPATGVLMLARAGHPHPVLRLPDGTCLIKHVRGGLPLGLLGGANDYPVDLVELDPGEILMLCTDGLIENGGDDMFTGWVRLRDALTEADPGDLEGMADRLLATVETPDPEVAPAHGGDDIALLLLRRDAHPEQGTGAIPERRLVLTLRQDRPEGLAEARAELRLLLHDWARQDQVDTAVLLTSELLGNVLVHTDQSAALAARLLGHAGTRHLRVEVTDQGDELPHQQAPGELASSGRGLILLDLLASAWGVRPEPEGKTVWFELNESEDDDTPEEKTEEELLENW